MFRQIEAHFIFLRVEIRQVASVQAQSADDRQDPGTLWFTTTMS